MPLPTPTEQEQKSLAVVVEDFESKTELQRAVCLCLLRGDNTHEKIGRTLGITADEVRAALREALSRLDGNRTDCVWIEIEDVGALTIGGGPSGFVVVSFPSDGSSSHVVTGEDDGTTVELQVGGQTGVCASVMVLPATSAFEIAERFLLSGSFDPALKWVEDCPAE